MPLTIFIYILYSIEFDRHYVGQTQDLHARLDRHNKGYVKSTKKYKHWNLKWSMQVGSRSKSMKIESKIKAWKSAEMLNRLINEEIDRSNW